MFRSEQGEGFVMSDDVVGLERVFAQAIHKYQTGAAKYGRFDPTTDRRDLLAEAEDELLDCLNYLGMFLLKVQSMRNK